MKLPVTISDHRAGGRAAHGLSNTLMESLNTKLWLLTRVAFGFRSAKAVTVLAMLSYAGVYPPLPGREMTHEYGSSPHK